MRLLDKETLELQWFVGNPPPYIILSHRWRGAETSLKEFTEQCHKPEEKRSSGTAKVIRFCKEVAKRKEKYVWVDTCCIDKSSSAELQEAINMMYQWYERASLCLVYLDDVKLPHAVDNVQELLSASHWFSRGWTLQELLAPQKEIFMDIGWNLIGDREYLGDILQAITGVDKLCMGNRAKILSTTVAARMSWVSSRQTPRVEDIAYCMLGLFDVNISMLYGEGEKAFMRLQKQIVQEIDDETIFLWLPPENDRRQQNENANDKEKGATANGEETSLVVASEDTNVVPMLAPNVSCFLHCRGKSIAKDVYFSRENALQFTTKGLEIQNFGERKQSFSSKTKLLLNCTIDDRRVFLRLKRHKDYPEAKFNRWQRLETQEILTQPKNEDPEPPSDYRQYIKQMGVLQRAAYGVAHGSYGSSGSHRQGFEMLDHQRKIYEFDSEEITFKMVIE